MRLLVTGRDGQVARAVAERGAVARIDVVALGRPTLDLLAPGGIADAIADARPDVVVNAAAYTAVDNAESEPDLAGRVNGEGAGAVALAAAQLGVPVLQLSTDYVFDGAANRPYREEDPTGPLGAYGRSKLDGERRVAAANPRHVILRTAWVYAPFGSNFVRTMLRLATTRDRVGVVADQRGCPTAALDIADAILAVATRIVADGGLTPSLLGVFHMSGQGEASWADVAEAIFARAALRGGPSAAVDRITTAHYPTPARRPANSRLDGAKLAQAYGIVLPPWRVSLDACVDRLLADR